MKRKILSVLALLSALVFGISCSDDDKVVGNTGLRGRLTYQWNACESVGDTLQMSCLQTIVDGTKTIHAQSVVKVWCKSPTLSYQAGLNPVPKMQKKIVSSGYEGTNPRCYVRDIEIYLHDGQILFVKLISETHTYTQNGQTLFYPYADLLDAGFTQASAVTKDGRIFAEIDLDITWKLSSEEEKLSRALTFSYEKKRVQEVDKVLRTNFFQGTEWLNDSTFRTYVKKEELWQIAGLKTTLLTSPYLVFNLQSNEAKTIDVTDFDFNFQHSTRQSSPVPIDDDVWRIKRRLITESILFNNGYEHFENTFKYPLYDIYVDWENKRFEFDFSVYFREKHYVSLIDDKSANHINTGYVTIDGRDVSKTVMSSLKLKEQVPPDEPVYYNQRGEIISFFVSIVFDKTSHKQKKGIAKKCVVVRYEKGYDWGICNCDEDFPDTFQFYQSYYDGFNSAAKRDDQSLFELAQTVEAEDNIYWYDINGIKISGIDALTCMIYGWPYMVDGHYRSIMDTYSGYYSNNRYTLTIVSPNQKKRTFYSAPF